MQPAVLLAISSTCNIVHLFLYRIEVLPLKPISNVDIRHCVLPLTNGVSKGAEDSKDYWSKISKNVCAALLLLQHGNVAYYVLHYSRARPPSIFVLFVAVAVPHCTATVGVPWIRQIYTPTQPLASYIKYWIY